MTAAPTADRWQPFFDELQIGAVEYCFDGVGDLRLFRPLIKSFSRLDRFVLQNHPFYLDTPQLVRILSHRYLRLIQPFYKASLDRANASEFVHIFA